MCVDVVMVVSEPMSLEIRIQNFVYSNSFFIGFELTEFRKLNCNVGEKMSEKNQNCTHVSTQMYEKKSKLAGLKFACLNNFTRAKFEGQFLSLFLIFRYKNWKIFTKLQIYKFQNYL